jgi:hypothetical protein
MSNSNIPLYGSNLEGGELGVASAIKCATMVWDLAATTAKASQAQNAEVLEIPADCIVLGAFVKNAGDVALISGTNTIDIGGTDLMGDLASLAAGDVLGGWLASPVYSASAQPVLVDGGAGFAGLVSATTVEFYVLYLDGTDLILNARQG